METFLEPLLLCPCTSLQRGMQILPRVQVTALFAELRAAEENSLHEYSERKANLG